MSNYKTRVFDRVLAILLTLVMLIGITPISTLAGSIVNPNDFTITVKDSGGTEISGATVDYDIKVNGISSNAGIAATGADGVAVITDMTNFITNIEGGADEVTISYSVTQTDYVTKSGEDIPVTIANDNIPVTLLMETVNVSVVSDGNGTITLNSSETASLDIDKKSDLIVAITPSTGYQINTITIDGTDQPVTDPTAYSTSLFQVMSDTVIDVSFVKVYTLTVSYDSTNGGVTTTPANVGGSVIVEEGKEIVVMATPSTNYRVSSVVKNSTLNAFTQNDHTYSDKILSADANYTYEITFAPNQYNITVQALTNGTVTGYSTKVDYDGNTTATITPSAGYNIESVKVNNADVADVADAAITRINDNSVELVLNNIIEDQSIEVMFSAIASVDMTNNVSSNLSDAVRKVDGASDTLLVFKKNTTVEFSTTEGIRINGDSSTDEWWKTPSWDIDTTVTITKIEIFDDGKWYDVKLDKDLRLVIDDTAPTAEIIPVVANESNYYNSDITATVTATDDGDYSGIDTIEYWVVCENIVTQGLGSADVDNGVLYDYSVDGGDILGTNSKSITVNASKNNSKDVKVYVKVTDLAGNEYTTDATNLLINTTKPTVSVDIDGSFHGEATTGYYNSRRTATITIVDREDTFDEAKALEGINIAAKNKNGNEVAILKESMLSDWTHTGNTHTATLTFNTNANYKWSIAYKNKADVSNDSVSITGDSVYEFTVDATAPTGTISIDSNTWNQILSTLTFGIWKKDPVTVTAEGTDDISPLYDVKYYKSDSSTVLTESELIAIYENGDFTATEYTISTDEKFAVYARITDYAGNTLYIGTNGAVYDATDGIITMNPDAPNSKGFYNADVNIAVSVDEEAAAGVAYSGIKTIDLKVESNGKVTRNQRLYTFNISNPTYDQLEATWSDNITINAAENNSDEVKVTVIVCDNAGNKYEKGITLAINTHTPEISVEIDGVANKVDGDRGYFGLARTATIQIIDRASTFDADVATEGINITAEDVNGDGVVLNLATMISSWSSSGNVHTATVVFDTDANYAWSIAYTNKAGNPGNTDATVTGDGATPNAFTVDKTDPTGTITVADNTWDKILNVLTFGWYNKFADVKVDISATADDVTSPVIIEYLKTDDPIAMSIAQLDGETFAPFGEFNINNDEQFVVYLKISDYAGNYIYINSDGYIFDKVVSEITITPDEPSGNDLYNDDVEVAIKITDAEPYSGIQTIEYWVENNNVETQRKTLYNFDYTRATGLNNNDGSLTITDWATGTEVITQYSAQTPTQAQLCNEWNGTITIDADSNNGCDVVLYVKTVDNAGNEDTKQISLDIDVTKPTISVEYDNNADNSGNSYFDATRTATIKITERTHHFDAAAATEGIEITAIDAKGQNVAIDLDAMISSWTTVEGATPDDAVHKVTITYDVDANYTFDIAYTDKAGNHTDPVTTTGSVAPYIFTIDTVSPTGTVSAESTEGRTTTWDKLVNSLTFGFWSGVEITVSGTSDDVTSPVANVQYYKTNDKTAQTKTNLDAVTGWSDFNSISVKPNEQFTVYIKITDNAGNYTYISTDGMIVDDTAPREESIAPKITVSPEQPINGLYNGDVQVGIEVKDPLIGDTFSGMKTITYRVLNMGTETQSGTLYSFTNTNPTRDELLEIWTGEIVVDSTLNNSNDVVIEIYAEDNALNSVKDSVAIKIDITVPTIDINYNNNAPDSGKYYKNDRVATIVVTERNFNADDANVTITNTDGVIPTISAWTEVRGSGNLDNTTYTATIPYHADGDYTFAIAYTDLADNQCTGAVYATGTTTPAEFTIDQTLPLISVAYDNNSAENGKYFKTIRTAAITVAEHNFDVSRVHFAQSANAPAPSWTHSGDVHTATIAYTVDGDYTFDVAMTDMAGSQSAAANYGTTVAGQDFTVDTNIVKPVITGVENNKGYSDSVIPAISFDDVNYNNYNATLMFVATDGTSVDVTTKFIKGVNEVATELSGTFDTFEKIEANDGIYTLAVNVFDKAGNTEAESVTFSVNRFGSNYVMSTSTAALNGSFVKEPIDVVITEINANELSNIKNTLFKNNETITLKEGDDYKMDVKGGNGEWYEYTYTIFAKNFADDGVYKITLHSEDGAGNIAENTLDTKNMEVSFGVDDTNPTIVVTNLESGKTYALENLTVLLSANDNLKLSSLVIYIEDKEYKSWSGEELEALLADKNGEFTFDILGDSTDAHNIRVVCTDAAGNETVEEITNFFVTTNLWVRYYNNKALFFGSIGGVLLLTAGLVTFIVLKKKKKAEEA